MTLALLPLLMRPRSTLERPRSTLGQSLLQDHLNAIEVEELDMEDFEGAKVAPDFEREDDDLEESDVNEFPQSPM